MAEIGRATGTGQGLERVRIGIDTGGTFTDVVLIRDPGVEGMAPQVLATTKVSSTPGNPSAAPLVGLRAVLEEAGVDPRSVVELDVAHGTTVATNAVIERRGARTCLVTTRGFRDVLAIGRLFRTEEELYDLRYVPAPPIVPARDIVEVDERVEFDGSVSVELTEAELDRVAAQVAARSPEAVAVSLLFSFVRPDHERRLAERIRARCPGVLCMLSSDVLPEMREYERTATTVVSAYVGPRIVTYATEVEAGARALGIGRRPHVMQSNGGLTTVRRVADNAAATLLSGPAGGVAAAAELGRAYGIAHLVTADMGGTSFDVGLVVDGTPARTVERRVLGSPVRVPAVDVEAIGAGGGSIAWVDAAGGLQVGPRSAGAEPGPACYERGGTEPTVTDADLLLGFLDPDYFLGGRFTVSPDAARRALEGVAGPLGLTAEEAAQAVHEVVVAKMADAIRLMTVQRGLDPRDFTMLPYGGAGPTHAVAIARELEMERVVVPRFPGVQSAIGMCSADVQYDYVGSLGRRVGDLAPADLEAALGALVDRAGADLDADAFDADRQELVAAVEMRYVGQGFPMDVPLDGPRGPVDLDALTARFHDLHRKAHGFDSHAEPIEVVGVRVRARGHLASSFAGAAAGEAARASATTRRRSVLMPWATRREDVRVVNRVDLRPGDQDKGPLIVEQPDTTTVVPAGCQVTVLAHGDLEIRLPEGGAL
ncbi:MAG: hydantoinase/oxoprolinase family protein [Acidimicrobiia bacterium]